LQQTLNKLSLYLYRIKMSDKYGLTRRDFMKIAAVAAGVTACAAKVAGARDAESGLGAESSSDIIPESHSGDNRWLEELGRQMIQMDVCYRRLPQSYIVQH